MTEDTKFLIKHTAKNMAIISGILLVVFVFVVSMVWIPEVALPILIFGGAGVGAYWAALDELRVKKSEWARSK